MMLGTFFCVNIIFIDHDAVVGAVAAFFVLAIFVACLTGRQTQARLIRVILKSSSFLATFSKICYSKQSI
jgi:hypothetical protein